DNGDINKYLNYGIYKIFQDTQTIDNGLLGQYINSPDDSYGGTIFVSLKNGLYKMTSKLLDNGNINVSNDSKILIQNLPLEWKSGNFSWSDSQINMFSSIGLTAINNGSTSVILPMKTVSLHEWAFNASQAAYNSNYLANRKIKSMDMSLTSIISLGKKTSDITNYSDYNLYSVFSDCTQLSKVILPKNLVWIGSGVFYNTRIVTIDIPSSVEYIDKVVFLSCKELVSVDLQYTKITVIARSVFEGCSKLRYVKLNNLITRIDYWAFMNCVSLEWVNIPNTLSIINTNAFLYDTKISLFVRNNNMKNFLVNRGLDNIISSKIIIGNPPI
ncbi:MAG: leucine-rich repeat domain-containing protein, partial [Ureaplasma sp.]|nr:leucine-rich repeat domain-containing protein [Ureaplasma sp.]